MVGNSIRTMSTKSSYNANVNSNRYNLKNGNYSIARRTQLNENRKICDTSIVINDIINISMKIASIDSNLSISQSYSCNNTNMNEISSICIDIIPFCLETNKNKTRSKHGLCGCARNCGNMCSDSFSMYNAPGDSLTGQVFTGDNANNTNTIDGNENRITNINDSAAPNLPIIVDSTDGSGKMLTKNINIKQASMLIVISIIIHCHNMGVNNGSSASLSNVSVKGKHNSNGKNDNSIRSMDIFGGFGGFGGFGAMSNGATDVSSNY